jgi:two-component system nitrogen regulation response regulator GlnG
MNRDPAELLRSGAVRPDLFYRLAGFEIRLPPLRERGDDLRLLAEHFLRQAGATGGGDALRFADTTLAELRRRKWPGNVRELRNVVEQAAVVARRGIVESQHLPPPGRYEAPHGALEATALVDAVRAWAAARLSNKTDFGVLYEKLLAEIEPPLFEAVLHQTLGNRAAAADLLGIHRATLRKKLNGSSKGE